MEPTGFLVDKLQNAIMTKFEKQVRQEHYFKSEYDDLESFISYYYQTRSIIEIDDNIKKVLEVGIGNRTLTNYLLQHGFNVTTCDHAEDLHPDYVADVKKLPFSDNEFDVSLAFEILEHIPFSDFKIGLSELTRVSKKYVIISIPNSSSYIEFKLKFSFPKIRNKSIHGKIQIPNFLTRQGESNHKWEMNKKGYPAKKIRDVIKTSGLEIMIEFEPQLHSLHHFFIMKKSNVA